MKSTNAKSQSENHFIKECIGTEFNLSIPAKITYSNTPFIYFYCQPQTIMSAYKGLGTAVLEQSTTTEFRLRKKRLQVLIQSS